MVATSHYPAYEHSGAFSLDNQPCLNISSRPGLRLSHAHSHAVSS